MDTMLLCISNGTKRNRINRINRIKTVITVTSRNSTQRGICTIEIYQIKSFSHFSYACIHVHVHVCMCMCTRVHVYVVVFLSVR